MTPANAVYDKDSTVSGETGMPRGRNIPADRRSRLLHKRPDASLDLHGLNCEDAWKALHNFFEDSRWRRLEKILIIHGKGNHIANLPSGETVLRETTKRFIESCSFAGESGFNPSRSGGRGATWVCLKEII